MNTPRDPPETLSLNAPRSDSATSLILQSAEGVADDNAPASLNTVRTVAIPGYEFLDVLGRGAMGVVYKARQIKANRVVALKMILAGGHASPAEMERFRAEGQAIAGLNHPYVVQIYDVGDHDGLPYFSLEFCSGGSLANRLKGNPIAPLEAAKIVEQLARGMAAAHGKGIVHRDLKPGNILIADDGSPKLTDFGLAKQVGCDSGVSPSELTATGAVMGTPSYMAPEQASGETKHVGPACDIYALGAVLYECLTGRPPFKGTTLLDTLNQVRNREPVAPGELQPATPRDLETICLKCLRKEPEKRYASAQALADDLQRYLDGIPILARPVGRVEKAVKWLKRNPLEATFIAVILGLLLGGSALVYAKYLDAREQERIATRQAGIAKQNEYEAKRQQKIAKDRAVELDQEVHRTKRQRDNATVLAAQGDFANKNPLLARERLNEIDPENRGWEWHYLKRLFEGGSFTLSGHIDTVSAVAVSADGGRIVTGSFDRTARVWEGRTGRSLFELKGHVNAVTCVAISPDGERIVTGSRDKTARVWDGRTGQLLFELAGHAAGVNGVAISADGGRVVSGSNASAWVWDGRTGSCILRLSGHADVVHGVAVSADGGRIMTGSTDETARIWDGRTGRRLHELKGHTGSVTSVAVNADGSRVVTGSWDHTARIWDCETGRSLHELKGHIAALTCVVISADGSRVVTGSFDKGVQIWDGCTGHSLFELRGHTVPPTCVAVNADGSRIVTASSDRLARVWDGHAQLELRGHTGPVHGVAVCPASGRIVTASDDQTARVWDSSTGQYLMVLDGHTSSIVTVAVSTDGSRIVTGSRDMTARIWDARTGESLHELKGHSKVVSSVAISADCGRVVTGSGDGTARVWDARNGQTLLELKGHKGAIYGLALTAEGDRIVTVSRDQTARVWDGTTGQSLFELKGHNQMVSSVAVSADSGRIVTGSYDKTARIWDARTGQCLLELKGHIQMVSSVAISADGERIVTGSADKTARVWDAHTGQSLLELKGHTQLVNGVAFSADNTRIVSVSSDKSAWVWDSREALSEADERQRRLWLTRPDPVWHMQRQKELTADKNDYGAALHRSFEYRARGVVALDFGRFAEGFAYLAFAQALMPKAPATPEFGPLPRVVP